MVRRNQRCGHKGTVTPIPRAVNPLEGSAPLHHLLSARREEMKISSNIASNGARGPRPRKCAGAVVHRPCMPLAQRHKPAPTGDPSAECWRDPCTRAPTTSRNPTSAHEKAPAELSGLGRGNSRQLISMSTRSTPTRITRSLKTGHMMLSSFLWSSVSDEGCQVILRQSTHAISLRPTIQPNNHPRRSPHAQKMRQGHLQL